MRLYVAAVYAADGIRTLAAARTREQVECRLAAYVRRNAGRHLWPDQGRRVLELLDEGRLKDAIDHYFANVGERWDPEFLHVEAIDLDGERSAPADARGWLRSQGNAPAGTPA